jgi:hypothetical protein
MKIFGLKILHLSSKLFALAMCLITPWHAESASENPQECCNGQPNISARFHPNSREFHIFVAPIIWTAKEAGTDCWAEAITSDQNSISNDLKQVHFGWDIGFRVGAGYGMQHDQWDTNLFYTWFHTKGKGSTTKGRGTIHSTFLGNFYVDNPKGAGLSGPSYESASIDWTIGFHMFDWNLGRNFWISKSLSLGPFIGVKGGWIHQFIHSKWQNPHLSGAEFFNVGIENIKNNFWGIGPEIGINTQWVLFSGQSQMLSLFGDIAGSIMWGHWSFSDVFNNDLPQQVIVNVQPVKSGASMMRVFTGLEWKINFQQNCYQLSTKLGYEMQFWLNQLQFYSFTGGRLNNTLTLQGGTLEFCFDF